MTSVEGAFLFTESTCHDVRSIHLSHLISNLFFFKERFARPVFHFFHLLGRLNSGRDCRCSIKDFPVRPNADCFEVQVVVRSNAFGDFFVGQIGQGILNLDADIARVESVGSVVSHRPYRFVPTF